MRNGSRKKRYEIIWRKGYILYPDGLRKEGKDLDLESLSFYFSFKLVIYTFLEGPIVVEPLKDLYVYIKAKNL